MDRCAHPTDLVKYARSRGVRVVVEIEMPGKYTVQLGRDVLVDVRERIPLVVLSLGGDQCCSTPLYMYIYTPEYCIYPT